MEAIPYWADIEPLIANAWRWLHTDVLVVESLLQLATIAIVVGLARLARPKVIAFFDDLNVGESQRIKDRVWRVVRPLVLPILMLFLLWILHGGFVAFGTDPHLFRATDSLLLAWIVIRLVASFMGGSPWSKPIATAAWTLAALNILGILDDTVQILDGFSFSTGTMTISLLGVIKGLAMLAFFLWLATALARFVESRLNKAEALTPSMRVLFGKLVRIGLIILAFIIAVDSVGIDLTALAVFGGAIGIGIGFGLQKVVSNLISGVILLMDRSVKPGDVIAIGQTYGIIETLGARYVSVITRDGIEHIIPNEELITQRVENWSFSNTLVRLKIQVGISYDSDVPKAMDLAVEAAAEAKRVLADPVPTCQLLDFADSAVLLELRIWISDPDKGLSNVRSEIRKTIWQKFQDNDISFPYPQQDLHIRSAVPFRLTPDQD